MRNAVTAAAKEFFSSIGLRPTTSETLVEIVRFSFDSHMSDDIAVQVTAEAEAVARGRSLAFTAHAEHARFAYAFGRACARFERERRKARAITSILSGLRAKNFTALAA